MTHRDIVSIFLLLYRITEKIFINVKKENNLHDSVIMKNEMYNSSKYERKPLNENR